MLLPGPPGGPGLVAQSAATGACIGRWRRAIHLALELQSQGIRGNAVMFGAVLAACDACSNVWGNGGEWGGKQVVFVWLKLGKWGFFGRIGGY